jgi:hypothetical protein
MSTVTGSASRNWALLTVNQGPVAGLSLPEHARLEQLTPVIHLPARYQAALDKATSTSPRSGRCASLRFRGHQRRGDGFELGDQLVELGGG